MEFARSRRLIMTAAIAGLLIRLAFAFLYWHDKPLTHDEREYLALAASVSAGRGFTYPAVHDPGTAQQFGRAPGYPLFLAAIGVNGTAPAATPANVKIAQAIVGAAGVWVIGLIGRRAAGPLAGSAAAAIAAVYPPLVWICAYALSEALYSTIALLAVLLLDAAVEPGGRSTANSAPPGAATLSIGAGLATGAAILVRPAMLFFFPLAVVWLGVHRRFALAAIFAAAAVLIVAPWTVRNFRVYDRFVLVASEGGVTFWTGNHPLARGEGDLAANPRLKAAELSFRAAHPGATAEELEPLYYRDAIEYIRAHPQHWLLLLAKKAFYTIVPVGPSYTLHSTRYQVASIASYVLLLPLAILGIAAWWRTPRRPEALFLLAASAVIVSLLFFPQERFRIPVMDPTLIVCAGIWCGSRLQTRSRSHC
jgi:hypothetical protein